MQLQLVHHTIMPYAAATVVGVQLPISTELNTYNSKAEVLVDADQHTSASTNTSALLLNVFSCPKGGQLCGLVQQQ